MPVRPASYRPQVSLLMVVRNGAAHIDAALVSARRQTLAEIEIVVVDDGSTDATCDIVRRHAHEDPRVRLETGPQQGLAAIRNNSLQLAAAPWGAIVDSDDVLHPNHVRNLIDLARRSGAALAAANMIAFDTAKAELFAHGPVWAQERAITPEAFARAGRLDRSGPSLGYLKPLFRLDALAAHDLRYDPRLRIGEDYDLVERALAHGLSYAYAPEPTYFYRRHAASTSYRLGCDDLSALIAAEDERQPAPPGSALARERTLRRRSLVAALAHIQAVAEIKTGHIGAGLARLIRQPAAARLMARSVREGLGWRVRRQERAGSEGRWSAVLLGAPPPGSRIERAARLLADQGCDLRWIEDARCADPVAIAQSGRGVSLVLIADESHCDAAAFAIPDGAPVIGDGSFYHPIIDRVLPSRPEELVRLAPQFAAAHRQARAALVA